MSGISPGFKPKYPSNEMVTESTAPLVFESNAIIRQKKKKGFAAMTPERRRELASLGGLKSQEGGKGHRFDSETAREAVMKRYEKKS